MIKQSQIDYLPQPLASANNIDLLTTDKTQYFAQPRPMISQGSKWQRTETIVYLQNNSHVVLPRTSVRTEAHQGLLQ